jgi:D-alanyl-D-alanine dipeptidase
MHPAPTARIYGPSKSAMRSIGQTKLWVLDFEQASPKTISQLMGWTSSADVRQQVRTQFGSKAEAIAYCEQNGIPYRVFEPARPKRIIQNYADNFAYTQRRRRAASPHPTRRHRTGAPADVRVRGGRRPA